MSKIVSFKVREPDVLVRRMGAAPPVRSADAHDRNPQDPQVVHRPRAGRRGDERHLAAGRFTGDAGHQGDEWVVQVRPVGALGAQDGHVHRQAVALEVRPNKPGDLLGILIGHQAEVHFGPRAPREHRLRSRAGVPALQAADRTGRLIEQLEQGVEAACTSNEPGHAELLLQLGFIEREHAGRLELAGAGPAHTIVEPFDEHAPGLRIFQRRQRPGQPGTGAFHNRAERRVEVAAGRDHLKIEVAHPLDAQRHLQALLEIALPELPDAGVGPQCLPVALDVGEEVHRANFLLAFDEELHPAGQPAVGLPQHLDGREPRGEVAFVVGDTTPEEPAVPDRRLKRGRRPLVERVGRLDVVVIVEQQRAIGFAGKFRDDDRGGAIVPVDARSRRPGRTSGGRVRRTRRALRRWPRRSAGARARATDRAPDRCAVEPAA